MNNIKHSMELLIRGDYLVFCIGNIISDATIAIFAFFVWYRQRKENRVNSYLKLLKLEEIDLLTINTALALSKKSYLNEVKLSNEAKQKLSKVLDSFRILNYIYLVLLFFFILGVFVQLFAIAIPRI
jgi:hypothetical protein